MAFHRNQNEKTSIEFDDDNNLLRITIINIGKTVAKKSKYFVYLQKNQINMENPSFEHQDKRELDIAPNEIINFEIHPTEGSLEL